MRFFVRIIYVIFIFLLIPPFLFSDMIVLKDGTKIEGKILDVTPRGVNVKTTYVDIIISPTRIQEIIKESQETQSSNIEKIPPRTQFEEAEELYHEGKILDAYSIYLKVLEEEPENKDVNLRLKEIDRKLEIKVKSGNLISADFIKPISENEVILLVAKRTAKSQPRSQTGQTPFAGQDSSNPLFVPPQQNQISSRANINSTQPQTRVNTPNSDNSVYRFNLPPLQLPSNSSNPPLSQSFPNDSSGPQSSNIGSPFFVPQNAQSAPNLSTPFQNNVISGDSSSGFQSLPPLSPFGQTQSNPQLPQNQNLPPFSVSRQQPDNPNLVSQVMEPRAPMLAPASQLPVSQASRSPLIQETSKSAPSYGDNQSLPPYPHPISAQATPLTIVSARAPFLQDQQAPSISPTLPNSSPPFLTHITSSQPNGTDQSQTPPLTPVTRETPLPSFIIPDNGSQISPTAPTPAQTPVQTPEKIISQGTSSIPKAEIPTVEFRGVWISRFEWPDENPSVAKQKILRFLDNISANNFNAVVFQIRGQGDVLYPSPYEPWSQLLGGRDPGFDPLKLALEESHARNLEFHAYLNVYPVWQGVDLPPHPNPEHPFWLYCQPDSNPNFLCVNKSGQYMKPDKYENDNYYYFSPGIPQVSAYVRKITMDVVNRYDTDGIHFDRIRYPGMNYSYDKISQERFKGEGNPGGLSWQDWQRDQITRFLNDVYGEMATVKPHVKISVSGWGIYNKDRYPGYSSFSSGYHQYYQDTFAWMKKGVIDALMPMIYWDIKNPKPNYDELAKDFIANSSGRHVYCANWANQDKIPIDEFRDEVNLTRQFGGQGNIVFSIGGLEKRDLLAMYKKELYPNVVTIPDMPWKSNPSTGIIVGNVLRKDNGEPITDAQINITGKDETWLSSSDGFFAVLNLAPGSNYQITVTKNGIGKYTSQPIQVQAGQVSKIDIPLGG